MACLSLAFILVFVSGVLIEHYVRVVGVVSVVLRNVALCYALPDALTFLKLPDLNRRYAVCSTSVLLSAYSMLSISRSIAWRSI